MKPAELGRSVAEWLEGTGPDAEAVLSSRVRLARNLATVPFPHRADAPTLEAAFDRIARALRAAPALGGADVWALEDLSSWDRKLLAERHVLTTRLVDAHHPGGVCVSAGEGLGVLIHEEDHVRIQSVVSGFDPSGALAAAVELDRQLESALDYAVSPDLGYLTACPTNVGTGMRASVLVHLPALVLAGEIRKVHRAVGEMGMAVRGWFGEGSRALGDFHQISNQRKLGWTEEETVEHLARVCRRVLDLETEARRRLVEDRSRRRRLEDRVFRSFGTLRTARLLSVDAVMAGISDIRLGKWMNHFEAVRPAVLNRLALQVQPAHLGRQEGRVLEGEEAEWGRARLVRAELGMLPSEG